MLFVLTNESKAAAARTIPITVREVKRLLAAELNRQKPPGHAAGWLQWRRRHQARSRWFHQRARLARNYTLVNWRLEAAVLDRLAVR